MNALAHDHESGYVSGVAYPDRFHRELMPTWLQATVTALGHAPPALSPGYRWLELGCGGGLGTLVAAACNPGGHFTGIDLDVAQVERAQALALAAGLDNVTFIAADFRDFAADDGEPFDFIVSHGVWSWVSPQVQEAMLAIIATRLRAGGIVQLGYMSHPGASQLQAVHKLMREASRHAEGGPARQATTALELLRRIADGGAGFFAEHPGAARQVDAMARETPEYLVHEFLGAHWQPQHSADMIRRLAAIGCHFIGSADPLDNIDVLSIPGALQPLLRDIPPGPLAETVRDLARNQSLRRDLFQHGARVLAAHAHLAALDALVFGALPGAPRHADADLCFDTRIGQVSGPQAWFDPVLRALADGPQAFATLRRLPVFADAPGLLNQVLQALQWAGFAHPLRTDGRLASAPVLETLSGHSLLPLPMAGTALVTR